MSLAVREKLVARLVFQDESQKSDLLDPNMTQTELIAMLGALAAIWHIEVTAVRSDHHDDSGLNPTPPNYGTHAHGWAIDCWPLRSGTPGDYLDAGDPLFQRFLKDASGLHFLLQIGLAGSADTPINHAAAGETVFSDDGPDHVHISAKSA
jgi:hypothetical protein